MWAGASPKAGPENRAQTLQNRGLVSKVLGAALSKVMAEIRATCSLQVTLHSEGNVWSLWKYEGKCSQWGEEGKSRFSTRLNEERVNPVLCSLGRGYRETSFWGVHFFSGDMMWRLVTSGRCGRLFPCWGHLQPGCIQARLKTLIPLVCQTHFRSPELLVDLDQLPPFLVHYHTWPSSCAEVLGRSWSSNVNSWL